MIPAELVQAMEADHDALNALVRGDPAPKLALFSQADDVTLANPLGPPVRGFEAIAAATRRVVAQLREGEPIRFERISQVVTADLAYIVEIERSRARIGGSDHLVPFALRATTVFRREDDGAWRVCHRHADPITTARPIHSLIDQT
jgi:ketosteroid isomerase-like protein